MHTDFTFNNVTRQQILEFITKEQSFVLSEQFEILTNWRATSLTKSSRMFAHVQTEVR